MARWKEISKLSGRDEKGREAAFEAAMMAELAKEKPAASQAAPVGKPEPPPVSSASGIRITVTENGQTTTYDLDTVPLTLRQQIVNAWLGKPSPGAVD